jgi:hypothetical protein
MLIVAVIKGLTLKRIAPGVPDAMTKVYVKKLNKRVFIVIICNRCYLRIYRLWGLTRIKC